MTPLFAVLHIPDFPCSPRCVISPGCGIGPWPWWIPRIGWPG